jgi:tRNA(adenine34) deaminase
MPEVFAPPPEIVSGYMEAEVQQALIDWNPIVAEVIRRRGLFGSAPRVQTAALPSREEFSVRRRIRRFLRDHLFDYFGRK